MDGFSAQDAARAHAADLAAQARYGVNYLRYWMDAVSGKWFCLVEALSPKRRPPSTKKRTG